MYSTCKHMITYGLYRDKHVTPPKILKLFVTRGDLHSAAVSISKLSIFRKKSNVRMARLASVNMDPTSEEA